MKDYFINDKGQHFKKVGEKFFKIIGGQEVDGLNLKQWVYAPPTESQDKETRLGDWIKMERDRLGIYR